MRSKKLKSLEFLGEAPTEASQNLYAPELAPSDKRITGRTKPLSLKTKPEFHRELKKLAIEENCLMIEVLEKALEAYEVQRKKSKPTKKLTHHVKIIPAKPKKSQPKLSPYKLNGFECDKCGDEYCDEVAYSYATNLGEINNHKTYCLACIA